MNLKTPIRFALLSLAFVLAPLAGEAATYTWDVDQERGVPYAEFNVPTDTHTLRNYVWGQIIFTHNGKRHVYAFYRDHIRRNMHNGAGFEASIDSPERFNKSIPLFKLTRAGEPTRLDNNRTLVTTFTSELVADYRLYVRHMRDEPPGGEVEFPAMRRVSYRDRILQNIPENPKADEPNTFYTTWLFDDVDGLQETQPIEPAGTRNIHVVVLPLGAAAPNARDWKAALSAYEQMLLNLMTEADTRARENECKRKMTQAEGLACWRQGISRLIANYLARTDLKDDELDGPFELVYIRERLGSADYAKFVEQRGKATGDKKAPFVARWRAALKAELKGYVDATEPNYDPDAKAPNLKDQLRDPLERMLAERFPKSAGEEKSTEAEIVAFLLSDESPKPAAERQRLKDLLLAPGSSSATLAAVTALKTEAVAAARDELDARAQNKPQTALGRFLGDRVDTNALLDYYCPNHQRQKKPAPGTSATFEKLKEIDENGRPIDRMSDESARASVAFEETIPPVERMCNERADEKQRQKRDRALAEREQDRGSFRSDDVPPGEWGDGKYKPGKAGGQPVEKKEKADNEGLYSGIKLGLWAMIIGAILFGPVGALVFAAAGLAIGMGVHHGVKALEKQ